MNIVLKILNQTPTLCNGSNRIIFKVKNNRRSDTNAKIDKYVGSTSHSLRKRILNNYKSFKNALLKSSTSQTKLIWNFQ